MWMVVGVGQSGVVEWKEALVIWPVAVAAVLLVLASSSSPPLDLVDEPLEHAEARVGSHDVQGGGQAAVGGRGSGDGHRPGGARRDQELGDLIVTVGEGQHQRATGRPGLGIGDGAWAAAEPCGRAHESTHVARGTEAGEVGRSVEGA